MKDRVTASEVAARAGVSQSAVSRVFTPGASASEATARKVRKAAKELGYRPNTLARAMITGRSRIIGLVVAHMDNQFYPEVIENLSRRLQEEGYHTMVFIAANEDDAGPVIADFLDYQVDGIITASVGMSNDLTTRCAEAGIPVVMFNRTQDGDAISSVTSDNISGGRKVAEFLIRSGHERIGYIAGWEGASTQRDREAGLRLGLTMAGHDIFAREVGNFNYGEAVQATERMFATAPYPDAVFAANDHMAFAVMDTLRHKLGLRVPEDVSVVGYDDVKAASWPSYDLTTLRQPANRMAAQAVMLMLDMIGAQDASAQRIAIDGPLILRGSARLPKETDNEGV